MAVNNTGEKVELLLKRSVVYQLLSRMYRFEPDRELFDKLVSDEVIKTLKECSSHINTKNFLIKDKTQLDELSVEFCRLFIGPAPCVPPYESVHSTEPGNAGQFWGDATVEIKSIVETLGLCYSKDFHEMPDHISVEFELMYRLIDAEINALESDNVKESQNARHVQRFLLNKHLLMWLPSFCDKMRAASKDPFFVEIANLTQNFLESEQKSLGPLTHTKEIKKPPDLTKDNLA